MNPALEEKTGVIRSQLEALRKAYHVQTIAFFGSIVRDDFTPSSDIDLMVEFEEPIGFFKFNELERRLSSLLERKVDLVTKNTIKPSIKPSILKEAVYV